MPAAKKGNGFTLVEVLIVIAILGFFFVAIASLDKLFQANFSGQRNTLETEQSVSAAMDMMIRELRGATSITQPAANATSITFVNNANPSVTVIYRLNGNSIERQENNGSFIKVTDSISSLAFNYITTFNSNLPTKTISIYIKGAYQDREVQMKDSVALRNVP